MRLEGTGLAGHVPVGGVEQAARPVPLSAHPFARIFALWLLVVAWRPWVLGFYHDDWVLLTINDPESWVVRAGGRTRPLYLWIHQCTVALIGDDAFAWHVWGALLALAGAVAVFFFCDAILRRLPSEREAARFAATIAGAAWLAFPWGLGYAAWPVMFPGTLALIMFCAGGVLLLSEASIGRRVFRACCAYAVGCLIYESFWFAYIPLVILLCVLEVEHRWRHAAIAAGAYTLVQAVFVVWNRALTSWGGSGKQFDWNWLNTVSISFDQLPVQLALALGIWYVVLFWLLVLFGCALFFLAAVSSSRGKALGVLVAAALGAVISMVLFAVAGYAIAGTGVFSRSTLALNLWFAVATGLFFQLMTIFGRRARAFAAVLAVLLIGVLAFANVRETLRWKEAWEFEQEVLRRIPVQALRATAGKVLLLADLPRPAGRIEGFEAFWDLTAAIQVRYPELGSRIEAAVPRNGEWETSWDGAVLHHYWCNQRNALIWSRPAPQLIAWKFPDGEPKIVKTPFRSGCKKGSAREP